MNSASNSYATLTMPESGTRSDCASGWSAFIRRVRVQCRLSEISGAFSSINNVSLPKGRHNLKFGADFSRYTIDTNSPVFLGGFIDFAQLPIMVLGCGGDAIVVNRRCALSSWDGPELALVVTDQPLTVVQQASLGLRALYQSGLRQSERGA